MKAVIVEIKEEFASVLADDGCILKIKNQGYEIGQVIQLAKPGMNIMKKLTMISASAAAVLVLGIGTWAYASPYSYVSLDVNPSIEYIVNRFDRVLEVNAVNDDGEEILNTIDLKVLKNKNIRAALSETVEQIREAGYFNNQEEGGIMIATSAPNQEKAEELAVELQNAVEEEIVQSKEAVTIETISVPKSRVNEARELGVTPGKLNLVEKLQESASGEDDISIEEWLNKPVKDIMKATQSYSSHKSTNAEENEDVDADSETNSGMKDNSGKDKTDKNTGNGKDKSDQDSGNGKDKIDQGSGNNKDKSDQGSGNDRDKSDKSASNSKDKSDQGSANGKDKSDQGSGSGKDKSSDKSSGNSKDKSDQGSGGGKDKSDQSSGGGKDKSNQGSGNSKDKSDKSSANGRKN